MKLHAVTLLAKEQHIKNQDFQAAHDVRSIGDDLKSIIKIFIQPNPYETNDVLVGVRGIIAEAHSIRNFSPEMSDKMTAIIELLGRHLPKPKENPVSILVAETENMWEGFR
jgi:hypothetical protein